MIDLMFKIYSAIGKHRRTILFISDLLLWNLSWYLSYGINRNNLLLAGDISVFLWGALIENICFTVVFLLFRLYDKLWRYADIEDFFIAAIASLTANLSFMITTMVIGVFISDYNMGTRVYITFALMSSFFMMLFRIVYRLNKILERRELAQKPKKRLKAGKMRPRAYRDLFPN